MYMMFVAPSLVKALDDNLARCLFELVAASGHSGQALRSFAFGVGAGPSVPSSVCFEDRSTNHEDRQYSICVI